jgi:hypothetical protein
MNRESGFRASCREQAGLAFAMIGRYFTKPRHVALNLGCLILAPFITLFVWTIQAMFLLMIGVPILTYALLMAAIGGGFTRHQRNPQMAASTPAPPPAPPAVGEKLLVTADHKWMTFDGRYVPYTPPPAPPTL